jgi:plastocyanin
MRVKPSSWVVLVALAGIAVIVFGHRRAVAPGVPGEDGEVHHVRVEMRDSGFEPRAITVPVGTIVDWIDVEGRHALHFDESGMAGQDEVLDIGASVSRTFRTPGRYPYHCALHGEAVGRAESGVVIVSPE